MMVNEDYGWPSLANKGEAQISLRHLPRHNGEAVSALLMTAEIKYRIPFQKGQTTEKGDNIVFRRIDVEGDAIYVVWVRVGPFQSVGNAPEGKQPLVLGADKPLFLNGEDGLAIRNQGYGRVMTKSGYAEDFHGKSLAIRVHSGRFLAFRCFINGLSHRRLNIDSKRFLLDLIYDGLNTALHGR